MNCALSVLLSFDSLGHDASCLYIIAGDESSTYILFRFDNRIYFLGNGSLDQGKFLLSFFS
ncbi:MAG: hypothetical protein KAX30_05485, partial [Candidatus Atribacteria bacterium]|nr:hypothetical protein [Candidatus Atribacteria bacterium]